MLPPCLGHDLHRTQGLCQRLDQPEPGEAAPGSPAGVFEEEWCRWDTDGNLRAKRLAAPCAFKGASITPAVHRCGLIQATFGGPRRRIGKAVGVRRKDCGV